MITFFLAQRADHEARIPGSSRIEWRAGAGAVLGNFKYIR